MAQNADNKFPKKDIYESIVGRFEKQVDLHGEEIAVTCNGEYITYLELNRAANRVAREILCSKVSNNEQVAIFIGHDISAIIAILGILKAGKTYLPLDPKFPEHRLRYMVEDSEAGIVITDEAFLSEAKNVFSEGPQIIKIDMAEDQNSDDNLGLTIEANSPAYILYSSGSTGTPKGIIQTHQNVLHHIWDHTTLYDIGKNENQALVLSISFAASVSEIFCPLLNGGKLCLYDIKKGGLGDLAAWLRREKISIIKVPISLFRVFIKTLSDQDIFPDLRLVILGGDTLYRRDINEFRTHFSEECVFVNRLTSTETNSVTQYLIKSGTKIDDRIVPVGYPAQDKEVLVVDEEGNEVGLNEIGEIVIKSRFIASGYWRKTELSEERFIRSTVDKQLITFYTGDLGRFRPDGCLEHIGRKDFMVKIRGFRVEIAEVTAAFLEMDIVDDAVVIAAPDKTGEKQLIGYVVLNDENDTSVALLRKKLSNDLPDYMIPKEILVLEQLPKTPTGKIDYQNLPEVETATIPLELTKVAPKTKIGDQLLEIWRKVLNQENIGVDDDFFDRGGNSLDALRMLAEVEQTIGKTILLPVFLQARTIAGLGKTIESDEVFRAGSYLVPLEEKGSKPPFFCVPPSATTTMTFGKLAQHMGEERPFYGFEYAGMDGESEPHLNVESMAKTYLKDILTIQPEGPYFLGGMCFGGLVAFEMAKQLLSMDKKVAFLGILDSTHAPNLSRPRGYYVFLFTRYLNQKFLKGRFGIRHRLVHMQGNDEYRKQILDVFTSHNYARMKYRTTPYPEKIVLFNTTGRKGRFSRHQWEAVAAGGIEIIIIPGMHTGQGFNIEESQDTFIREPHVQILAKKLNERLDHANKIMKHKV